MFTKLGPACGRRERGRYTRCTSTRLRRASGAYAPACARHLTRAERGLLGLAGGDPPRVVEYVDIAKLRAGDRD